MVDEIGTEEFDERAENGTLIAKFYGPGCGACKELRPVFEAVAENVSGASFAEVNVAEEQQLGQRYGIRAVPAILAIREGEVRGMQTGMMEEEELRAWVEQSLT